jgi:hypothetical protein
MIGMIAGLVACLAAGRMAPMLFGWPGIAWTWNVAVGAVLTFVIGWAASQAVRSGREAPA